jgi:hypothetical protein
LERSGDYALRQDVLDKALKTMNVSIDIDLFANQKNRKCQRFMTVGQHAEALARDAFSMTWKPYCPLIHPPIPLILKCLRKLKEEGGRGVVILPAWKGQVWANLLHQMMIKSVNLGESSKVLIPGKLMLCYGSELPPGTIMACFVDGSTRMVGTSGMRS